MNFENILENLAKVAMKKIKKIVILACIPIILFIIIIGCIAGVAYAQGTSVASNSEGMNSATVTTGGSSIGVWGSIDLYNADGTVNEEKIDELERAFEAEFNLVTASLSGNNIGGRYNPTTCKAVTGTYLGWDGVEEGYSTSYTDTVTGRQYKGKNQLGIYQCTWWANGRASEYLGRQFEVGGDGGQIYDNAAGKYVRGGTPKQNSLVSYKEDGDYGHVAYVEAVDEINNCYYISHAGGGRSWFGIQRLNIGAVPWSGYTLVGFVYLDEPLN